MNYSSLAKNNLARVSFHDYLWFLQSSKISEKIITRCGIKKEYKICSMKKIRNVFCRGSRAAESSYSIFGHESVNTRCASSHFISRTK